MDHHRFGSLDGRNLRLRNGGDKGLQGSAFGFGADVGVSRKDALGDVTDNATERFLTGTRFAELVPWLSLMGIPTR